MQTHFTADQLADPKIREADDILRKCVHCGFCTATCPTFVITGDERDSPRGRIWMMRELLESPDSISADTGHHIDRCLGCLSCMTTCPSGVDYAYLVEIGREKLDELVPRPLGDRLLRRLLAATIPHAARFYALLWLARVGRPFAPFIPAQMRAALAKLPTRIPPLDPVGATTQSYLPTQQINNENNNESKNESTQKIRRVALLAGCAQRALDPEINASTIRVLNRLGIEVVVRSEAHCCGALAHHIGETEAADKSVRQALRAWQDEIKNGGLDAIVVNASGCGTMVKDYGHLLKDDRELGHLAAQISAMTMDISQVLAKIGINSIIEPAPEGGRPELAYHSACSLQHGQKIHDLPQQLLRSAGFTVTQPVNPHLCCGSAGVYNILQPDMADGLRTRKLDSLRKTGAIAVAAGNIGCISQLDEDALPVRHTVQFIDWASGGPSPL
jgi:glycolate oxidase iron-sulfur subunit